MVKTILQGGPIQWGWIKFKSVARKAIRDIGYQQDGFHWKTAKIDVLLHPQSTDIAQGVDNAADRQGEEDAGDQGIMFGYRPDHFRAGGSNASNYSVCTAIGGPGPGT